MVKLGATKMRRKRPRHARGILRLQAPTENARLRLPRGHTAATRNGDPNPSSSCRLAYASRYEERMAGLKQAWARHQGSRLLPRSVSLGASSTGSPRRVGCTRQAMRSPPGGEPSSTTKSTSTGSAISIRYTDRARLPRGRAARRMRRSTRRCAELANKWDLGGVAVHDQRQLRPDKA